MTLDLRGLRPLGLAALVAAAGLLWPEGLTSRLAARQIRAGLPPQAPVQPPPPAAQFRAGVDLVEVNVSVTDRDGRPVRDLRAADFEVRESGRTQTVAIFDRVDIPLPPPAPPDLPRQPAIAADVTANDFRETGRAFAIVLDDLTQYPFHTMRTRRIAREFIERHVAPEDLVLVMGTSGRAEVTQEFTTDKGRALQAVERFVGLLPLCPPEVPCPKPPAPSIDPDRELNSYREQTLETLANLALHLRALRGRRASVVFIGDGFDLPVPQQQNAIDPVGGPGMIALSQTALLVGTDRTAEALQGANATFFAVRTEPEGGLGNLAKGNALDALADATGGMVGANNTSFVGRDFNRIIAETSHYYLLGYYPTERRGDGDYRSIDVRVRRPDVRVSHRPGYRYRAPVPTRAALPAVVANRAAPPPLATLLDSPMPTAGLSLRVQAIPLRRSDTEARVQLLVEVAGPDLAFEERDGRFVETIEFATVAYDDKGRRGPERTTEVRLRLTADERDRLARTGVRWVSALDLPRGRHDLRVAARAVTTNRHGSVFADVDVPRFDTEMSTSGLAVTSRTAPATFTTGGPFVLPPLPAPPTVQRRFPLGDVLAVSAEVYQASDGRGLFRRRVTEPVPAELRIRVSDAAPPERVRIDQPLPVMSEGHRTAYVSFAIPTAGLGPGRFVLRLVRLGQEEPDDLAPGAVVFEVTAR